MPNNEKIRFFVVSSTPSRDFRLAALSIPNAEDQEISVLAVSVPSKTTYRKDTWINLRNH